MNNSASLSQLLEKHFGVSTSNREHTGVSGTAGNAVQIVPNNPKRLGLTIVNMSANNLYIGPRNTVSTVNGIWVFGGGGAVTLSWDSDFDLVSHDWYVISVAGGDAWYAIEIVSQ